MFALLFASGAAALAHQIIWTRRLVDILGASADTFSKVVGAFFLTLEIAAKLNLSVLAHLKAQIRERTPVSLRNDAAANWQQWPARVKPDF